jgi:hypothetical protein
MAAIEAEARPLGISLLVLDTRTGDRSQRLYERIGYTLAGVVPCYARGTSGELEATSIMYKQLAGPCLAHAPQAEERTSTTAAASSDRR